MNRALPLVAFILISFTTVSAQETDQNRTLGSLTFPTSTQSEQAQAAFVRGMLLLHLFEYPHARNEFLAAQALDPDFAMAYWGEAMTHNHPIWDRQNTNAARDALMKLGATSEARMAMTSDEREKGWIAAIEVLYGPGTKEQRDQNYMRAMEIMAVRYPEDHEVQLFYALSILGVHAGVRDIPSYMLATAVAQNVFSANPQHPGAAHYLIHGVDDPVHAVLGMSAARQLASIAPGAGHAQHMASHIFLAVGMWDAVVETNKAAVAVANAMRVEAGQAARSWGHYNSWLLYGQLQLGRQDEALEMLEKAHADAAREGKSPEDRMDLDPDRSQVGSVVQMWARYLIDADAWDEDVAGWSFSTGDAFDPNLTITYIKSMGAARSGLVSQSGEYLAQFQQLKRELRDLLEDKDEPAPGDAVYLQRLEVMEHQLMSAREMARGDKDAAIEHARSASRLEQEMPVAFGPPFVDLPSGEFLGDLLQGSGKPMDAIQAYKSQLELTRLRTRTMNGLIRALERTGEEAEAQFYRSRLPTRPKDMDSGIAPQTVSGGDAGLTSAGG